MNVKAIGMLLLDVSGPHVLRDERVITELADQHGYTLMRLVTIAHDTFMPTVLIVTTAHNMGASAVIAPSADHIKHNARAIAVVCDLITPTHRILCTSPDRRGGMS
ncbi:hypothetical protein [Nocardia sp. NBC_01009]|uniref:hypothetical protein n=1 Tax=Nocardia sp. NBC_01009 TaxID=2975996 RepID=UPI00387035B4|nr:hypothetical protein OHA42_01445 [Nocardia sp. NBC_01009]